MCFVNIHRNKILNYQGYLQIFLNVAEKITVNSSFEDTEH